jgi:hypothetical protein
VTNETFDQIKRIQSEHRSVSIYWIYEHYTNLINSAINHYGSFEAAIKEAGLNPTLFLSGFNPETSKDLNKNFIGKVVRILKINEIWLREQSQIVIPEAFLNPIRIDQYGQWYIIKILPWSNFTRQILEKIKVITKNKVTIIYLKHLSEIPQLDHVEFKDVRDYLVCIGFEELSREIDQIASMLNVVHFEI